MLATSPPDPEQLCRLCLAIGEPRARLHVLSVESENIEHDLLDERPKNDRIEAKIHTDTNEKGHGVLARKTSWPLVRWSV